jgi:hypothetical protein
MLCNNVEDLLARVVEAFVVNRSDAKMVSDGVQLSLECRQIFGPPAVDFRPFLVVSEDEYDGYMSSVQLVLDPFMNVKHRLEMEISARHAEQ